MLLAFLISAVSAFTGKIAFSVEPATAHERHAILSNSFVLAVQVGENTKEFRAYPTLDGKFTFNNLPDNQEFSVSLVTPEHQVQSHFVTLKTHLHPQPIDIILTDPSGQIPTRFEPMLVLIIGPRISYQPPKQSFDVFQFLKNPMVLFGLGAMALMTFLTKMQANLDPAEQVGRAAEIGVQFDKLIKTFYGQE